MPNDDEHATVYVNGERQDKKLRKVRCPEHIDWQEVVREKQKERAARLKKARET